MFPISDIQLLNEQAYADWADDGGPVPFETETGTHPAGRHALGLIEVTKYSSRDRWGQMTDYLAAAPCKCGEVIRGRCCSRQSAVQWLRTNFSHHSSEPKVSVVMYDAATDSLSPPRCLECGDVTSTDVLCSRCALVRV